MTNEDKPVMAMDSWPNNAAMFSDISRLGYFGEPGSENVLDLTYGRGGFWKSYYPTNLFANDLYVEPECGGTMIDAMDLRSLIKAYTNDGEPYMDAVVWDAPYKTVGTPTPLSESDVDARYGVTSYVTANNTTELIQVGTKNASYLVKPGGYIFVKLMDQIVSGKLSPQSYDLVCWLNEYWNVPGCQHRLRLHAEYVYPSYRPQPSGRRQLNPRRNYSKLLQFQREK